MKMKKYKNVVGDVQKMGYGLVLELKRAGFWVGTMLDKPQAVDVALKNHMVDAMMDRRRVECMVIVSGICFEGGEVAMFEDGCCGGYECWGL
jgi:hypothetical protein